MLPQLSEAAAIFGSHAAEAAAPAACSVAAVVDASSKRECPP